MEKEPDEQSISSSPPTPATSITLQKAVNLGEYNPEYLSTFPEWHTLSNVIRWQMIK